MWNFSLFKSDPENVLHVSTDYDKSNDHLQTIKLLWPVPRFLELTGGEVNIDEHLKVYIIDGQCPGNKRINLC